MKKKLSILSGLLIFIFLLIISIPPSSRAGQVITEDARLWAREVLKEEKDLKAVEGQNTLAVLYFHNKTRQLELDPLQKGLTLMLITDLSGVKDLQVVERGRLQALIEEMKLADSGLVEPGTAPRIGKLLGAQWLVGGDLTAGQPSQLQIQSHLLQVPANKIVGDPIAKGELTNLFIMEKEILFELIKLLKIKVTSEEKVKLETPLSTNINALIPLFQGIDESDRGNYKKAAQLYEKALNEDPKLGAAKEAIDELKGLGLITVSRKSRELLQSLRDQTSLTDQLSPEDTVRRERAPINEPAPIISPITIELTFPAQ
ncbi:MAG: hypothetical protein IT392_08760 [Nitrospirae bacterium]|nr:hypothetical protein [Nitrospirota bacterium]